MAFFDALTICGLDELAAHQSKGVSHVVSIIDPDLDHSDLLLGFPPSRRFLFRFHDIIEPMDAHQLPTEDDVAALLDVGRELMDEPVEHLLVHCHMGLSRSTATAVMMQLLDPDVTEREAFDQVDAVRPRCWPNSLMLQVADELLGREGRLIEETRLYHRRMLDRHSDLQGILAGSPRGPEVVRALGQ